MIEREIAETERRLRLYRKNAPKRIADELGVHLNTVTVVNLGRHPIQARLASERMVQNGEREKQHGDRKSRSRDATVKLAGLGIPNDRTSRTMWATVPTGLALAA